MAGLSSVWRGNHSYGHIVLKPVRSFWLLPCRDYNEGEQAPLPDRVLCFLWVLPRSGVMGQLGALSLIQGRPHAALHNSRTSVQPPPSVLPRSRPCPPDPHSLPPVSAGRHLPAICPGGGTLLVVLICIPGHLRGEPRGLVPPAFREMSVRLLRSFLC